jgi:tetraacyldisaccharide 4'-kinase
LKAPAFWYPGDRSRIPVWCAALAPIAFLYDRAGRLRRKVTTPHRASVPVICIGNLTAGGTGKTPIAIGLARLLIGEGARPVFLTRGYGGREAGPLVVDPTTHNAADVGDEPLLLARVAATVVSRDRALGSKLAEELEPSVILMDDGFQNPGLYKDLSILVVDGDRLFGNERVIPQGPLREPIAVGLARADAIIVRGDPERARVRLAGSGVPIFSAVMKPNADAAGLKDRKVFAFAGIGNPANFFGTLERIGAVLVGRRAFADHHPYSVAELEDLRAQAEAAGARLVTTEKDRVRLPLPAGRDVATVAVEAAFDDPAALIQVMMRTIAPKGPTPLRDAAKSL